jgi:predicted glutamine amidotransferase
LPGCILSKMCRLLAVRAERPFAMTPHLEKLAHISKNSKEYQGHGWGCAYKDDKGKWKLYKNINPLWEHDFVGFTATTILLAHARSAFEDRDITIENNMPFFDGRFVYIFNGELRGVRIREQGRIGAEKIFNYIKRFDKGDTLKALEKAVGIIKKRSKYIRGMNIIMVKDDTIYVSTSFSEDKEYFTMHYKEGSELTICSEPYLSEPGWQSIENNTVRAW